MPGALPEGVPALEAAGERMRNRIPALAEEPLLDGRALRAAVAEVAAELAEVEGFEAGAEVARRLLSGTPDWELLALLALAGAWEALDGLARELDVEVDVVAALLDYAARPALREAGRRVGPLVSGAGWDRGTCPACGAPPLLSVTTGKEASRFLLCGRCGTSWPWSRARCATCGQSDHRRLGFLHGPGEGDYRRVEVCDACRGYLKTLAVLDLPDPDRLLRLDLDSAGLDFMALEAGYSRTGASRHPGPSTL
jgi:FdhE protein